MQTIIRRLRKLENRFGPHVETRCSRQLRQRIEEGRRRVAEARERGECRGSVGDDDVEDLRGLSLTEILLLGRDRVARAKAERDALQRNIAREGDV